MPVSPSDQQQQYAESGAYVAYNRFLFHAGAIPAFLVGFQHAPTVGLLTLFVWIVVAGTAGILTNSL